MSNQYFRFKQFAIEQEHCAMKVTTDACIQGAWTPLLSHVHRVLDIGAGTGLLSLMLAQRAAGIIVDAVEYDADAAAQARDNVTASPWADSVNVIEADVCDHQFIHKYDLIISNPPFFNNSLLGDKDNKNKARHTISLTYKELLRVISENLSDSGYASILLPHPEYLQWKALLDGSGFYEVGKLMVRHAPESPVKRIVSICSHQQAITPAENTLVIKDEAGQYTPQFSMLLAPFYLAL